MSRLFYSTNKKSNSPHLRCSFLNRSDGGRSEEHVNKRVTAPPEEYPNDCASPEISFPTYCQRNDQADSSDGISGHSNYVWAVAVLRGGSVRCRSGHIRAHCRDHHGLLPRGCFQRTGFNPP